MSTSTETAPTALVPAWDESGRLVGIVPPGAATVTLADDNEARPGSRVAEARPYGMVGIVTDLDPERRTLTVYGATGSASGSPAAGWVLAPEGSTAAPLPADRVPAEHKELRSWCSCRAAATRVHLIGKPGAAPWSALPWCAEHSRAEEHRGNILAVLWHPAAES